MVIAFPCGGSLSIAVVTEVNREFAACEVRFRAHMLQTPLDFHRSFLNRAVRAAEHVPRNWTDNAMRRIGEWPQIST